MRDEFFAAMEPHVASTRDEPGCVFFEYHRHKNDEDVAVLIEGCRDAGRCPPARLAKLRIIETVSDKVARYDLDFIANPPSSYRP
ncbi:antibiotic biosynthesis monooxygenase [Rhizobium sp. BK538]|uniref:putative quinol monooxygenase n=1 Tax=Rhizobium sp. BK538 TaxID=2586984 RepID=UPI001853B961|nr:hypothetical protein [Rhizobium sp. BK538]